MPQIDRRSAISLLAVTAVGGVIMPRSAFAQSASLITGADVCVITPETAEGPYYFDPILERRDITEGRPGLATQLQLQVVDELCDPLPGARVDIWHCDASGLYSGYANQPAGEATGETFMRGTQFADAAGVVTFDTVYPGWYRGRTPHIHFKVFLDETTLLTGQLFFPDDVSDSVYAAVAPYNARGARDRRNDNDGIALRAGAASIASVEEIPDAYEVRMIIGVAART